MIRRPSLLLLTAGAAGIAALANGLSAAAAPTSAEPATRLGAAIGTDLASRDIKSAQRGRQLDIREQATRSAEQRLQAAAASLAAAQPAAANGASQPGRAATGAAPADPQAERWDQLARIYQAMKPKAAAGVFEQLSMDVQVEVAQRMRERAAAAILAAMSAKGAAALTVALARRQAAIPG